MIPPTPRPRPKPLPEVTLHHPPLSIDPVDLPLTPTSPFIHVHEILRHSTPRRLYYDVAYPPSTVVIRGYSRSILNMAATAPPLTYLRIILPTTPFLPVMVYNLHGVTVFDVLNAIYLALHAPAGPSVWEDLDYPRLITPPPSPPRANSYHISRSLPASGTSPSPPEGRRKIEYLQGRTTFVGLLPGPDGPESWNLHTIR